MKTLLTVVGVLFWLVAPLFVEGVDAGTAYSQEELSKLGERIYREGIGSDSYPVRAVIGKDIPVDGDMFTCVNCHQRSGIGSVEGDIIAWPINGKELYTERRRTGAWRAGVSKQHQNGAPEERRELPLAFQTKHARPAYTDETLATLIRTGVDPTGRSLGGAMPKYHLSDKDMSILINYLKQLSKEDGYSPGVDEEQIRFATVITDDVSERDAKAMLDVLQVHIDTRNTETRPHQRRATRAPFYKTELFSAYRKLDLQVWRLSGEPATWRQQLESYYKANPVFALLGGISGQSWEPIHQFCEDNNLPSILPITDKPHISENDWYTLYFSRGLYQEGKTVSKYLQKENFDAQKSVFILYENDQAGNLLLNGFQDHRKSVGSSVQVIDVTGFSSIEVGKLLDTADPNGVFLVWLTPEKNGELLDIIASRSDSKNVFFSYGLLGEQWSDWLDGGSEGSALISVAQSLPGDHKKRRFIVKKWLEREGIPVTNFEVQAKMYFLGWALPGALRYMRSEFYRDYFMEGFDMMKDQHAAIAVYPKLTFSSGQRYLAKGAYIAKPSDQQGDSLEKVTEWVTN